MKDVTKFIKVFVLLIASYFVFAVLSCLLPDKTIKAHIAQSAPGLAEEGSYPNAIITWDQCQMDNFTDALIMNQIYNIDRKHPVRSAMIVNRSSEGGLDWDQPGLLLRRVHGEELKSHQYSRYWHGNTFLFRFVLLLMDFNMLRWTLYLISGLLMVMLLCAYYPEAGTLKTMALSFGFLVTCGFVTQFSMQFFPVLALTLIGSLLVIKRDKSKDFGLLFFIVGSLTCYFDLLTAPLLTLGIPLAVMLSLNKDSQFDLKRNLLTIIKLILLWGLGFALTFFMKWVLASLILGQNVLADAYEVALYRMDTEVFTRWDALSRNFKMIPLWMIIVAVAVLIVIDVVRHKRLNCKKALAYLLVGVMPLVWYLLL
ncbi:MAG: hypothetical protein IKR29_00565, partial [Bacteroidales bacterium]|nr:hypothetical protein [Bacteroidales bacterium]